MKNVKFKKRKKRIVDIFKVIFICNVIYIVVELLYKILYFAGIFNFDLGEYGLSNFIISITLTIFIYFSLRLAKQGKPFAGIIGIIIGFLEILLGGLLWKFIGIGLLLDSIFYLVYCKKNK